MKPNVMKYANTSEGTPPRRRSDLTYTKLSMHNMESKKKPLTQEDNSTDGSDDLRPTPRGSFDSTKEIEVDFSQAYDREAADDDGPITFSSNKPEVPKSSISSGTTTGDKVKKIVKLSSEDPIVFDSNPLQASKLSREAVDDYRHKVALAKEEKRLELERQKRKKQTEKEAKLRAAAEMRRKAEEEARLKAEEEARITAVKEREEEEARLAKEAADAAQAALETPHNVSDDNEDYIDNKNIHDKPPTPIKGSAALAGVGSALYTGLGIGLVANMVTKTSKNPIKVVDNEQHDSEPDEDDSGAWHDNYEHLKEIVKDDFLERQVFDDEADESADFNAEIERQIENDKLIAQQKEEELRLAAIEEEEKKKVAAVEEEEKKKVAAIEEEEKKKVAAIEEEEKKRAAALAYSRKLEIKRKIKKREEMKTNLDSARVEAAHKLEEYIKMEAMRAAIKAEAEAVEEKRRRQKEEEEKLKTRAVVDLNKHLLNPLTTAILTAIDFVDYKSKLDIATKLAQKMESDIIGTNVFDFKDGEKENAEKAEEGRLKALAEEAIEKISVLQSEAELFKEETRLKAIAEEENRLKTIAAEAARLKALDEAVEEIPMPPIFNATPFPVDPSFSQEDIEDLLALYNVLYSGFEVTKRSTRGQMQKRILHCDKDMLFLSWKEPINERRRSSSVVSMFSSKKSEDERLLDFQLIFGVMADPLNEKKVTISHPSRSLEIQAEDVVNSDLLFHGLSVFAKHNISKKRSSPARSKSLYSDNLKPIPINKTLSSSTATSTNSSPTSIENN